jgi:arsenate reductase (glutaredoxin)
MAKTEKLVIYHNPRCTKSRETLALIEKKKVNPEIVEYLKTTLTVAELKSLLKKLGLNVQDIIRKKEPLFIEKFKNKKLSDEKWLDVLVKNPILIERPIVVKGNKAVIGRPPENVLALF